MYRRIILDRATLGALLDRVKAFAAEYRPSGRARYVLLGNRLVNDRLVAGDRTLQAEASSLSGPPLKIELPFSAERIEVATNARIFGLKGHHGELLTAKLLMRQSGGATLVQRRVGKTLFADVRARRLAEEAIRRNVPGVFVPRVVAYDRKYGRWLVEEQITAQPAETATILQRFDPGALERLYAPVVRLKPVFRRRAIRRWAEALHSLDSDFIPIPDNAAWPVTLGHSDLEGNMLGTSDGRLGIIDWELAKVFPVAADLASIYLLLPETGEACARLLRILDPQSASLAPGAQLALGIARMAAPRLRRPSDSIARISQALDVSSEAATALHNEQIERFSSAIRTLRHL